jgi:hypothetical protein
MYSIQMLQEEAEQDMALDRILMGTVNNTVEGSIRLRLPRLLVELQHWPQDGRRTILVVSLMEAIWKTNLHHQYRQ